MLKTFDGVSYKRVAGQAGDRSPSLGFERKRVIYNAIGGETSVDISDLTGGFSYTPGQAQIEVKRSSGGGALISGVDFFESSPSVVSFVTDDPLFPGEVVEFTKVASVAGIMALAPRIDAFTATAIAGQTLIVADFSWDLNLNPAKGIGAVQLFINGIAQTRGQDFDEVDLGISRTNQLEMNDPLLGGENIQILPIYQAIDDSAAVNSFNAQTTIRTQEAVKAVGRAFVDESNLVSVPGTQIINRAKIVDPSKNLSAHFGIERLSTRGLFEIQKEIEANGLRIFAVDGDDKGRIRCAGSWSAVSSADGSFIRTATVGDYIEVTFLGTGLNLLSYVDSTQSGADFRVSIDGGSEGANICPALSAVLDTRSGSANIILKAAAGLSHALHTVKIRCAAATAAMPIYGVEIVNQVSSISVSEGSAVVSGTKVLASSAQSIAHNSSVTGTRGGRAVVYLNSDGTTGSSFAATDTSDKMWTNANHAQEDVSRWYHWREFGATRLDDFSNLTGSATGTLAFTLSDGTTTLSAVNPNVINGAISAALNGSITFTFIGTGLDFINPTTGTNVPLTISVDGVSIITNATSLTSRTYSVCSGLSYGVHTVKFSFGATGTVFPAISRFVVFEPKKPAIPTGCLEIADYNVLANVSPKTSAGIDSSAVGSISKMATREITYVGSWNAALSASYRGGWYIQSNVQSAYLEYSFFGTGFDFRTVRATDQSSNITVRLTNSSGTMVDLNASYPNAASIRMGTYGGLSFGGSSNADVALSSATNNVLNCNGAASLGSGFYIKDLPLGYYTVRLTQSAATATNTYLTTSGFDIFTPVHSQRNASRNVQNELTVGSCSIQDVRVTSPFPTPQPKKRVWAQASSTSALTTSVTSALIPTPGLVTTLYTPECTLAISATISFYHNTSGHGIGYAIAVDDVIVTNELGANVWGSNFGTNTSSISVNVPVSEGFHRIEVLVRTSTGIATISNRILSVQEL